MTKQQANLPFLSKQNDNNEVKERGEMFLLLYGWPTMWVPWPKWLEMGDLLNVPLFIVIYYLQNQLLDYSYALDWP